MKCNLTCRIVFSAVVGVAACAGAAPPVNQPVDWIGVNGSQKVVLDYIPCSNTVVEAKVDVSSTTKNHCIFCARGNNNYTRTYTLFMLKGADGWRFDYNNSNSNKSKVVPTPGTPTILRTTCEGLYVDGAKKTTYSLANFVSDNKMSLFFSYNAAAGAVDSAIVGGSNSGNEANMKVYYIKIWDDNGATLKYDLRPYRDADFAYCLHDNVSGANIYPYSASTSFTGPLLDWWEDVLDDPAVFIESGAYTNGFSPQVKAAFGPAIAVGYESNSEYVDLSLTDKVDIETIKQEISKILPEGYALLEAKYVPLRLPSVEGLVNLAEYIVKGIKLEQEYVDEYLKQDKILVTKEKKGKQTVIDIKDIIKNIEIIDDNTFKIFVRFLPTKSLKLEKILQNLLKIQEKDVKILYTKRERLFVENKGTVYEI